ncbi:MAG: HesA/MoeB/ThiF family protein [Methanomicrobiales archaeon]|nr:HesA/MoeB/ThiF family protein [Methanomicrobiales archaeon]
MLTEREQERYHRQILLFGEEGQDLLKEAHLFIAGAGGLGSPVSLYLAAAGVGMLTIVDHDMVERTNLNRQILHRDRDLGRPKVDSAQDTLREINPDITVRGINATIQADNVADLVGKADGIVDAVDNFTVRYLLNEVAFAKGIPLFHGAIQGFYGQAATIVPPDTACLRCMFPHPPPGEPAPVIGVTPGIIGTIQATEAIKYLLGCGELLTNRLFIWDGFRTRAEEIRVQKNASCAVCCRSMGEKEA